MIVKKKTDVIQRAIALGKAHGEEYLVIPHIGTVTEPIDVNSWQVVPFDQDTTPKPEFAYFNLDLMQKNFSVDQVLVFHEPKPEKKEFKVPELPKSNNENLKKILSFAAKVAAVGAVVVGYAAYAAFSTLVLIDPVLVVSFEGEEDWMLCIAQWDEV